MASRFNPQLPGRSAVGDPLSKQTAFDHVIARDLDSFGIEGPRAKPPGAQRIVDHRHSWSKDWLSQTILQKARPSGNRWSADRSGEMVEKRGRDSRIEQDRIRTGANAARIEPRD